MVGDQLEESLIEESEKLTRMLGGLCKQADTVMINLVPGLREWWAAHKATDAVREANSKARRGVRLAKRLTAEAIRAKGITLTVAEGHDLDPADVQDYLDAVATQIAERLEEEARGG